MEHQRHSGKPCLSIGALASSFLKQWLGDDPACQLDHYRVDGADRSLGPIWVQVRFVSGFGQR